MGKTSQSRYLNKKYIEKPLEKELIKNEKIASAPFPSLSKRDNINGRNNIIPTRISSIIPI